jgi:hypothetical protein
MTAGVVYPRGTGVISVPASQKIGVVSAGTFRIFRRNGYPNLPATRSLVGSFSATSTIQGTFSTTIATTIEIEADEAEVRYDYATDPDVRGLEIVFQGAPSAKTVAVTLTAAELLTKIITGVHTAGATQAYTLPTGTLLDAAVDFDINDSFDWTLINNSLAAADTITVTADTGHTVVGTMVCQSLHSTTGLIHGNALSLRTRKTAANTFVTYRLG